MSAIVSIFNRDSQPVDPQTVDILLAASPDRAVDGQDVWIDTHIALAQQHFWITPEEWGERQPLVDDAGRLVIAADARLDNRDELIRVLEADDRAANQLSDAALILLAYRRWGTACVQHFLGDFAFIIWDADEQHLFMARDVLGMRGLCYSINEGCCLVASEVVQLLAHPAVDPRINEGKIAEYVVGLYQDQEETYYVDIFYCPPAHCLVVNSESVRKWRYWDIDPQTRIRYKDEQEYADRFLELLTEAVRCRLRTVGPVGISMSGGLDSTMLAAVASGLLPQTRLKSFSYVFDELTSCDERRYIQPVVKRYQLEATFIPGDDKWTLRDFEKWPASVGFVFHDPYAWLPESAYAAAGQAGCRVLLGGYLGDVLFTGARSWAAGMMAEFRFGELAMMIARNSSDINWRRDLMNNGLRHMVPHSLRMSFGRNRSYDVLGNYPGIHPDLAKEAAMRIKRDAAQPQRISFGPDHWHRYKSLTLNVFAQGPSATRSQINRHGVELVLPYWDRCLVEFVMAVPAEQLGRPWRDRWLMRNAAAALLPRMIVERRQQTSFDPLMKKGLLEKEVATVETIMKNPHIVDRNYVSGAWLQQKFQNGRGWSNGEDRYFLWKCLSLEMWLKLAIS